MRDCKHGQLARSCQICELEQELKEERQLSNQTIKRITLLLEEWDLYGKGCKFVLKDILDSHRNPW